jgi:hypothetical protein
MTRSRLFQLAVVFALILTVCAVPAHAASPTKQGSTDPPNYDSYAKVDIITVDESVFKNVVLLDDKLEFPTEFGVLHIDTKKIRRIDFAFRVPADVVQKVTENIGLLGHSDFKVREEATAKLKGFKERSYPQLLKALKHDDPEISRRADEALKDIKARVPSKYLVCEECDLVHTEKSKISGKLSAEYLRVHIPVLGNQQLKLADIRTITTAADKTAEQQINAADAPGNMSAYQNQFGKEFTFKVTAFTPVVGQNPNIWGTDTYTLDSNLAVAVVHTGLAKPGETVVVRVRVVQSPLAYVSTFRNNVNSTAYGNYPSGAYEFIK